MDRLQEFYEIASNPQISNKEVRKRIEELKKEGSIHDLNNPPCPDNKDLVFVRGKGELFWRHMIEQKSFHDINCWTDGVVIGIPKKNKEAIEYVCQLLQGEIVSGWSEV